MSDCCDQGGCGKLGYGCHCVECSKALPSGYAPLPPERTHAPTCDLGEDCTCAPAEPRVCGGGEHRPGLCPEWCEHGRLLRPEPPAAMTMDEARADLAKGILKFLNARMKNAHAAIEKLPIESVRERNDHAVRGLAANELALQMAQALARLERPRILRPERSLKVVR